MRSWTNPYLVGERIISGAACHQQHCVAFSFSSRPTSASRFVSLTLPSVATLSAFHFARAFKTSTGTTPRAFIEQRRIEKAKQLLRESVLPLAHIALEAGFQTQSRFTTAFRRITGFTPAVYRKGVR